MVTNRNRFTFYFDCFILQCHTIMDYASSLQRDPPQKFTQMIIVEDNQKIMTKAELVLDSVRAKLMEIKIEPYAEGRTVTKLSNFYLKFEYDLQ